MIRGALVLYMGFRGLAAASNLLAVAIFTRLAGPEVYGHYVVAFAAAAVISGVSVQWIRYAFFNHYRSDEDRDFFASFLTLIVASMAATVVGSVAVFALDHASFGFAAGALLIGLSIALFDVVTEVCRTRLEARRAALSVALKAILVLAFGTAALTLETSALALAAGVAAAHLVAAVPAALTLGRLLGGRPSWIEIRKLVGFGWPLMLSFGIGALAQGVDRFVLAGLDGAAATGAYGALSDLVRASFTVLGEGISLATVPLAKRLFSEGRREEARQTLEIAYRLFLVVGVFLTAALLVVAPVILPVVFPAAFLVDVDRLLPVIMLASCLLVIRNVYFAQTIYFTGSSRLELASAMVLMVVNLGLCLLLIPDHGAFGAALAFLAGQAASCLLFIVAGRGEFPLPASWRPLAGLVVVGGAMVAAGRALAAQGWPLPATLALQAVLFLAALGAVAYAFGLRPRRLAGGGTLLARCGTLLAR